MLLERDEERDRLRVLPGPGKADRGHQRELLPFAVESGHLLHRDGHPSHQESRRIRELPATGENAGCLVVDPRLAEQLDRGIEAPVLFEQLGPVDRLLPRLVHQLSWGSSCTNALSCSG